MANLIITFFPKKNLNGLLEKIRNTYEPQNGIWLLRTTTKESEMILSYTPTKREKFLENSMSVHRKSDTATIYTINAMNELIRTINNGVLDKTYQINWDLYRDTILLQRNGVFCKIPYKVEKTFW